MLHQHHCKIKNAFDGLINRLDKAEERISKLDNISKETSNNKKAKQEKMTKKKTRVYYQRTEGQLQKV